MTEGHGAMSVTWRTWLRCSLPPPGIPDFQFSNFILGLFTEVTAQARSSRSQDRDKATSIKILFNTETDRTCPLIKQLGEEKKKKEKKKQQKTKGQKQSKILVELKNKVSLYFTSLFPLNLALLSSGCLLLRG